MQNSAKNQAFETFTKTFPFTKYLQWFDEALLPPKCLFCKKEGHWLCQKHKKFEKAPQNAVFFDYLDEIHATAQYSKKNTEKLITQFKFKGLKIIAKEMAPLMVESIPDGFLEPHTILVPVPLHPIRKFWRGFNQSEVLAEAISVELQKQKKILLPVISLLERTKRTKQQAKLNKKERIKNLQNAFTSKAYKDYKSTKNSIYFPSNTTPDRAKNVILIDDVVASGQTLDAAAKTLKEKNNFNSIKALVFARGGK